MSYKLPKHIIKSILSNKTSLGDHPALPPDEEEKFLLYLLDDYYQEINEKIEINDIDLIKQDLQHLLTQCKKIERSNIESLQNLCLNVLNDIFDIPEDTIDINCNIVEKVDVSKHRFVPEKTTDFTFDDIDDMTYLTQEIYKRRMLNALIVGAAMFYSNHIDFYVQDLFKIHPELPSLYKKILDLNTKLLYLQKDTLNLNQTFEGGKVDVLFTSSENKIVVNAEAIIFPILLEESIKGILEVAISHGLPQDRIKAEYVSKKADFRLAEVWDMRLGVPLWLRICSIFDEKDLDILDNGLINFFLYEISTMDCEKFNHFLQNVFKHTKKGKDEIVNITQNIIHEKELDDFNDFMSQRGRKPNTLNDDESEFYTSEELIADCLEY